MKTQPIDFNFFGSHATSARSSEPNTPKSQIAHNRQPNSTPASGISPPRFSLSAGLNSSGYDPVYAGSTTVASTYKHTLQQLRCFYSSSNLPLKRKELLNHNKLILKQQSSRRFLLFEDSISNHSLHAYQTTSSLPFELASNPGSSTTFSLYSYKPWNA